LQTLFFIYQFVVSNAIAQHSRLQTVEDFGSLPKALGIWRGQNNKSKKLENKIYFCLK
jgi:hypothetical protein